MPTTKTLNLYTATVRAKYRQAIITKYIGPTNNRGARIKAWCEAGAITIPFDYALNQEERHCNAVSALLEKLDWGGDWLGSYAGKDMIFVDVSERWKD